MTRILITGASSGIGAATALHAGLGVPGPLELLSAERA